MKCPKCGFNVQTVVLCDKCGDTRCNGTTVGACASSKGGGAGNHNHSCKVCKKGQYKRI